MKKLFSGILLLTVFFLVSPAKILADSSCQTIYGGGQTCVTNGNITINKTVANPKTNQYVDNLSMNDTHYKPGETVWFKLDIKNTGNGKVSKVEAKDVFPQYVTFVSGPGSYNNDSKTLTFYLEELGVNETKTFTIQTKIVDVNQLPINEGGVVCVVNQGIAVNQDQNSQQAQDNAQFCIEKVLTSPGFPTVSTVTVATTPATGAESLAWISLIPTGISGWFLRKKAMIGGKK
jgi:uncharacterized repeat protein (TIGR01451 family)